MDNVAAVLAELQDQRGRLAEELARVERVISVIEELTHRDPSARPAAEGKPSPPPAPRAKPYVTLNVYEATAAYLAEVGVPKTSREIADAISAGGYPTRSTYFCGVVGSLLRRKESTRQYRISATPDGRRWFVR